MLLLKDKKNLEQLKPTGKHLGGKFLTFSLSNEEYGLGILKIKEIIGMMEITPVPSMPNFIKGVINLRGKVIPVMSLRLKFGMEEIDYTDRTCIIVVEITGDYEKVLTGIIVDSVSEVLTIKDAEIEETPDLGSDVETEYIMGLAKTESGVKILLNIDLILRKREIVSISNI